MDNNKALKYMKLAIAQANIFSKDESTKVGALILGPTGYEIRAMGYNGLPRGANDNVKERNERPEKYFWYEHAERNAIYNAARVGTQLEGSILIVTMMPCMDCARGIVQVGVRQLITTAPDFANDKWGSHFEKSLTLFKECGVDVMLIKPEELNQ